MSVPRESSTRVAWRRGGFVLIEVALVLLVGLLGAGLVLLLAGRFQQRGNCERYIHDLRIFSAAFADHFQQRQAWPATSGTGTTLPAELAETLRETNWFKGSSFGGTYGWVAPQPAGGGGPGPGWGGRGAVTLTAFAPGFPLTLRPVELLRIDRQIDDGNLATGRFRAGFNGWPVFLVETPKR